MINKTLTKCASLRILSKCMPVEKGKKNQMGIKCSTRFDGRSRSGRTKSQVHPRHRSVSPSASHVAFSWAPECKALAQVANQDQSTRRVVSVPRWLLKRYGNRIQPLGLPVSSKCRSHLHKRASWLRKRSTDYVWRNAPIVCKQNSWKTRNDEWFTGVFHQNLTIWQTVDPGNCLQLAEERMKQDQAIG